MQTYKKKFAEFLVRADALQFGEFTLKAGVARRIFQFFKIQQWSID